MTKQSPLGKNINFPKAFSKDLLHPISRAEQRDNMLIASLNGYDMWNIFELLWIDQKHFLHQNQISIKINCNSEFIPESKSMKLFLGSLIYKNFENKNQLYRLITNTLNDVLNTSVEIYDDIYENTFQDHVPIKVTKNFKLPQSKNTTNDTKRLCFAPFRSLCPVTSQPDIAKINIRGQIGSEDIDSLSSYLGSFFDLNVYHEKCIEQIYLKLIECNHQIDFIEGHFERRGGISIIPVRLKT